MKKTKRTVRGFTLIELLLYLGLLSLFLVVLTQIFTAALDVQLESESTGAVEQDGRYMLNRFTYDLSQAQDVVTPASPGSQSSSLQLTVNHQSHSYSLSGNNLVLTNNFGTNQVNTALSAVSQLSFLRLGNPSGKPSVQVSFTLTSTTVRVGGAELRSFQTTVGLR